MARLRFEGSRDTLPVSIWLIALLVWLLPALVLGVAIGLSVLKENRRRRQVDSEFTVATRAAIPPR